MIKLILLRHGQSQWNLENRFTGWCDADLTEQGISEAKKAGYLIKKKNIIFNFAFTSFQKRANKTLLNVIEELDKPIKNVTKAWQLNERHYGALTGLNKIEMSNKIGEDKVYEIRRSWDIKPEPLNKKNPYHPINIETYNSMAKKDLPDTESLKDTFERVTKYFGEEIEKKLETNNVLITAHGNSIRALCKNLFNLDNNQISNLEIPTGNPLIIELNKKLEIIKCEYLDKERAKSLVVF
jgi:2,3-bisphosphoglycerate-dependent phosphoglycerate mutase